MSNTVNDDINILQASDPAIVGAGAGNDVYIVSPVTLTAGQEITLTDTKGSNTLQLIAGLTISNCIVAFNALQLTLSNGAIINVNGADTFIFNVSGNAVTGDAGVNKNFATFASENLGITVPDTGTSTGGGSTINDDGSSSINPTDPVPENTNNDSSDLFSTAQSKSVTISGIDHDTLVSLDNYIVASLYEGDRWLNFQNSSDPITYSFNETLPLEYYDSGETAGWQTVAPHVRDVIDAVMSITDGMILPDIEKIFSGQIRFNMIQPEEGVAAYAYYPNSQAIGGDVFLGLDVGTDSESGSVEPYGVGRSTIVHELGHALGLTHPFEGASVLPVSEDHSANTIMSYTDYRLLVPQFSENQTGSGSEVTVADALVAPDHFMPYDIAALQAVYGPDTNYRTSDTIYTFGDAPFYTTIWDAGGVDLLDFSGTGYYNVIDLTPGSHSTINYRDIATQIAEQQAVYQAQFGNSSYDSGVADIFNNKSADIYTGENALAIAWGTLLENVTGGPAGNRITDNAVDNYLTGGVGDDLFYLGAGGFDTVVGGGGYDLVMLDQYTMDQVELGIYEDSLLLAADGFAVQMVGIAGVQFADQLYTVV